MGSPWAQLGSGKEFDVWALDSVGMISITNHTALPLRQGNSVGCCLIFLPREETCGCTGCGK